MRSSLKRCPFCGAVVKIEACGAGGFKVECGNCGAVKTHRDKSILRFGWNRRRPNQEEVDESIMIAHGIKIKEE